jgi:hypothetical protein
MPIDGNAAASYGPPPFTAIAHGEVRFLAKITLH